MPPKAKTEVETATTTVVLKPIEKATVQIPIVGVSPLIPHNWSQKALEHMRSTQAQNRTTTRAPKDAAAEAEAAQYHLPDGRYGMPATAFKAAIVGACRLFGGISMVLAKQIIFVNGTGPDQLLPLIGEYEMREDTPRNANGSPDLRYRYYWFPWKVTLSITFLPSQISMDSIYLLVDAAGHGGVGDWRPSAPKSGSGTYGRFEVEA